MVFVPLFHMVFVPILKPVGSSSPCKTVKNSKISDSQLNAIQENPIESIRKLKLSNSHKIMLGHLNVNFLRNNFEPIADVIQRTSDIFLLSETKIDESFPDKQLCLNNFRIFRKDRNWYGGRIMFKVNGNLPCKNLTTEIYNLTETIFLEVNIPSSKWLFLGCYKPPSQNESFISNVSKTTNAFSTKYDNILSMGDLNLTIEHLEELLNLFNLKVSFHLLHVDINKPRRLV